MLQDPEFEDDPAETGDADEQNPMAVGNNAVFCLLCLTLILGSGRENERIKKRNGYFGCS